MKCCNFFTFYICLKITASNEWAIQEQQQQQQQKLIDLYMEREHLKRRQKEINQNVSK